MQLVSLEIPCVFELLEVLTSKELQTLTSRGDAHGRRRSYGGRDRVRRMGKNPRWDTPRFVPRDD